MSTPGWYYRLSSFFKEKFGEKVYKIPLDAGLTCPNRDGTISTAGCIYCYNPGFSRSALSREQEKQQIGIRAQILLYQAEAEKRIRKDSANYNKALSDHSNFMPRRKYLAYFQSYSNTYGDISYLQAMYKEALETPGVIGLSIATRPDCLSASVLELLEIYARDYHIWLELGLQSSHDRTLQFINRGHGYNSFAEAVQYGHEKGLNICAHIINGLPGESWEDMLETARRLSSLHIQGIKFHQLQVLRGTHLEKLYLQGELDLLEEKGYIHLLCDQLEVLRHDITVHRFLAEVTSQDFLLAPHWENSRAIFAQQIEVELKRRGSWQGKKCL